MCAAWLRQANTCAECAGAMQGLHVRRVTAETADQTTRCSAALTFDTLNCPFLAASASFTRSTDTIAGLAGARGGLEDDKLRSRGGDGKAAVFWIDATSSGDDQGCLLAKSEVLAWTRPLG